MKKSELKTLIKECLVEENNRGTKYRVTLEDGEISEFYSEEDADTFASLHNGEVTEFQDAEVKEAKVNEYATHGDAKIASLTEEVHGWDAERLNKEIETLKEALSTETDKDEATALQLMIDDYQIELEALAD
jgi:Fe2+ or Zn2+ uptake regulation protein